ncbi:MAG: hypothetical protein WC341_00820 [Bacteroidales bacterium]|jgi:hypothetical protein
MNDEDIKKKMPEKENYIDIYPGAEPENQIMCPMPGMKMNAFSS